MNDQEYKRLLAQVEIITKYLKREDVYRALKSAETLKKLIVSVKKSNQ